MNEQMNMCPFCGNSIRSSDNATHCPACREFNRMRDRIADLEQKLEAALERGKVMEKMLNAVHVTKEIIDAEVNAAPECDAGDVEIGACKGCGEVGR